MIKFVLIFLLNAYNLKVLNAVLQVHNLALQTASKFWLRFLLTEGKNNHWTVTV